MRGTVLYGPRDVRFEDGETPRIEQPTDAVLRITATCVCGSDLWPYRGLQPLNGPTPMGHEYCGIVGIVTDERPANGIRAEVQPKHDVRHGLTSTKEYLTIGLANDKMRSV